MHQPRPLWPTRLAAVVVVAALLATGVEILRANRTVAPDAPASTEVAASPVPTAPVVAPPAVAVERDAPEPRTASSRWFYTQPGRHTVVAVERTRIMGASSDELRQIVREVGPVEVTVLDGSTGALSRTVVTSDDLEGPEAWRWPFKPLRRNASD